MAKKIDVRHLQIGMYVEELDRPWLGSPFLFQGIPLRTVEDIKEVQKHCQYVYISSDDYDPNNNITAKKVVEARQMDFAQIGFEKVVLAAKQVRLELKNLLKEAQENVKKGQGIEIIKFNTPMSKLIQIATQRSAALIWLTNLKSDDDYIAIHSINVCFLALTFCTYLKVEEQKLKDIGLGTLLLDIGMLRVPEEIRNKTEQLSTEEIELIKQHPRFGVEILTGVKGVSTAILDIVHSHHERLDGNGYPRGLSGSEITLRAQLTGIIDTYDAMTSNRSFQKRRSSADTISMIYAMRDKQFEKKLVQKFMQYMGVYPLGSLVELHTGEIGIVVSNDPEHALKPRLMLILSAEKKRYFPLKAIDLKQIKNKDSDYRIKKGLPPGAFGVNEEDLIDEVRFM